MDTRTLTQKNTPAFVERDPNLVDTIQTLDGLSSLVGLTTSETLPVIVDHFDPQAKELVCHVEFIPPWLGSIKKEIRIPLSRIAWASAFVEEIKAEALEAWGYENLESGLAEATAEKYGFSVRTIEDSVPQVRTAPIRIQPPDNRCVRLISGIPVYFDWNWLDRIDLLNERIDEPMPQFPSTVDTAAADGVTTRCFSGWTCFLTPVSIHSMDGADWEVAALVDSEDLPEPDPGRSWLPLLLRRDRFIYPRLLWRNVRDPFCLCGELIPFQQQSKWGNTSVALKVRGGAFRADRRPAFPFRGSMRTFAASGIQYAFRSRPSFLEHGVTAASKNEEVLQALRLWLATRANELGHHAFPLVTENIRDSGVDILLTFSNCDCRL